MPNSLSRPRYLSVIEKIRLFEQKYERHPGAVRLIAVSKTQAAERVAEIAGLGQVDFGENYLQEAQDKTEKLKSLDLTWHFIGHIQSRKTQPIATSFDWVHSVDRLKVANKLNQYRATDRPLNVLIQVNLQQENSKSGVEPEQLPHLVEAVSRLENLKLRGLMAIPRPEHSFSRQRAVYTELRKYFDRIINSGIDLDHLSIGMSTDLEAAIAEGATMVRIGTALFGPRQYSTKTG